MILLALPRNDFPTPFQTTFHSKFMSICHKYYHKSPFQWQIDVGGDIIESTSNIQTHNQLLVRKTGEGKSLVYLVTGTILRGVTLFISPLLSLTMDQARKVLKISRDSNISSFHLDEINSQTISVLPTWITRLGNHATIFIFFCSPQSLIRKDRFLTFLLEG